MKIIRWLLSHTFLILLIVAVIYGYMFWGNLAGENTPAGKALAYLSNEFVEVEEFIAAVKAKQALLTEEKQSVSVAKSEPVTEPGDSNVERLPVNPHYDYQRPPAVTENTVAASEAGTEKAKNNTPVAATAEVKQKESVVLIAPPNETAVNNVPATSAKSEPAESEAGTEKAKNNIPVAAIAEVKQKESVVLIAPPNETAVNNAPATSAKSAPAEKFISAETAAQLDNVDEHGKVVNATQQYDAVRSLWITARKSFYQRNYKLSEQSYKQVIDKTKDNVDAYGELGNVYFNQGKNKEAASAYFEAAAILVRNGQANRARSLMALLRHLDESKADELKQLIDSTLS